MERNILRIGLALMIFILSSFIASQSALAPKYTVTDLGTLGLCSGAENSASAINDRSEVVGWAFTDILTWHYAVLWKPSPNRCH